MDLAMIVFEKVHNSGNRFDSGWFVQDSSFFAFPPGGLRFAAGNLVRLPETAVGTDGCEGMHLS